MGFQLRNLREIEPKVSAPFSVLPKGDYLLGISDVSEETPNGKGGAYVYVEYTVVEGDYADKSFRVFYNIKHEKEDYADREWGKVSALGNAVGVLDGSADKMIGKTLWAKVIVKPENVDKNTGKKYGESNDITKYYLPSERRTSSPPTPPQTKPAEDKAPPTRAAGRPWGQKPLPVDDDIPF